MRASAHKMHLRTEEVYYIASNPRIIFNVKSEDSPRNLTMQKSSIATTTLRRANLKREALEDARDERVTIVLALFRE
jgi:hypothetical protein